MLIDATEHPEYPGVFVTKAGEVFRRISASPSQFGYRTVKLPLGGSKHQTVRVHTLVLETYRGPSLGRVARHGIRGPGDDSLDNLQWGTQKENCQDTIAHGRTTTGVKNAQAKLTDDTAMQVYVRYRAGESGAVLAREFGISQPSVVAVGNRTTWKHIHKPKVMRRRIP